MAKLTKKSINGFKLIYKEKFGKEISDEEALEMGQRLLNFYEVLFESVREEELRKRKLKKSPEGFHLEKNDEGDVYNCCIC